jgi:hypothetical protein
MNKIISIFLLLPIISACFFRSAVDVVISDKPFTLSTNQLEIPCNPPLQSPRHSCTLNILIKESWEPISPWKQIKLADGTLVNFNATLVGTKGEEYKQNIIGSATGNKQKMIYVDFSPTIKEGTNIMVIKMQSSSPISVERIIWQCFDNK